MRKIIILACLAALFTTLIVTGCTGAGNNDSSAVTNGNSVKPDLQLALYYAKFTQDESYLVREVHSIPYTEDEPLAAVKRLIEDQPKTPGATRVLPPDTRVLGVEIRNGTATVDFTREVLQANVGSSGEAMGIMSIVNTLTEFPGIEQVSFTVEGKIDDRTMDWWGHVGLYEQPFQREVSMVYEPAIWVSQPEPNQSVGAPMRVWGSALVNGNEVSIKLLDESGQTLASEVASVQPGVRSDFEVCLKYEAASGKGELVVSGSDARNPGNEFTVKTTVLWP